MKYFPWEKTSNKTYEQQYGFMGRFFIAFQGEEGKPCQFTICGVNRFLYHGPDDLVKKLQDAWIAMRYYIPTLASESSATKKSYTIPDETALKIGLEQHFSSTTLAIQQRTYSVL